MRLYKAARAGDFDTAMQLLSSGASVRYYDVWDHMTPLMIASYRGHAHLVVLLLGNGASTMARSPDGTTALHYAAGFGHADVCKVLCSSGRAVPDAKNVRGETPIDWAQGNGRHHIVDVLSQDYSNAGVDDVTARTRLILALKQHIRVLRWRIRVAREMARKKAEEEAAALAAELAAQAEEAAKRERRASVRASKESMASVRASKESMGSDSQAGRRGSRMTRERLASKESYTSSTGGDRNSGRRGSRE